MFLLIAPVPKLEQLLSRLLAPLDLAKFSQQSLLLLIEINRSSDMDFDEQISTTIAFQLWDPLSPQAKYLATLSPRSDSHLASGVKRLHFNGLPQGGLHHGHRDLTIEMVAIPFKEFVRLDV